MTDFSKTLIRCSSPVECAFEIAKKELVLPERISKNFTAYYDKNDDKIKIKPIALWNKK